MRIELELAASTKAVWHEVQLNLDRTPPVLTFNNPAVANSVTTVVKPYLQIQGSANKDLASLSYDINNANGVFTDQDVSVVDRSLDTNTMDFSTNTFQAYDVPLAVGDNHITLHMSDRAGNTTTTNFNAVLDYSAATTPPVVSLTWPTDGMKVSGNNITIRGKMSDETGTIAAQVDNGDGTFTTIPGVVERDHTFWIENVPFNGTSPISIQATDAAGLATGAVGHVTTTSLNISPSTVTLTINGWPGTGDLWKSSGYVSGTVSGPAATVTVNGWPVTVVNGTSWSAVDYGVPIYGEGTATFDAVAYDADGNPIANASAAIEKDSYYAIVNYTCNETYDQVSTDNTFLPDHTTSFKNYSVQTSLGTGGPWHLGYTGSWNVPYLSKNGGGATTGDYNWNWSDSNPLSRYDFDSEWLYNEVLSVPSVDYIDPESRQQIWVSHYYADDNVNYTWTAPHTLTSISAQARTVAKLYTGGKAVVGRQSLFCITAGATEYLDPPGNSDGFGWYSYFKDMWAYTPTAPVANSRLKVGGKQVGADGNLWIVLPEYSEHDITIAAIGIHHYDATVSGRIYPLTIMANDKTLSDRIVRVGSDFCVGEGIYFNVVGLPPGTVEAKAVWDLTGSISEANTFVNQQPDKSCLAYYVKDPSLLTRDSITDGGLTTSAWYVKDLQPATIKVDLYFTVGPGAPWKYERLFGKFNVFRPTAEKAQPSDYQPDGTPTPQIVWAFQGHDWLSLGDQASHNDMSFKHQINPGGFSGNAGYTQIITSALVLNSESPHDLFNGMALDGKYGEIPIHRDIPANINTSIQFGDGPATGLPNNSLIPVSEDVSFSTYLRFQPDLRPGDPGPNIYVPLRLITWELHDHADPTWNAYPSSDMSGTHMVTTQTPVDNKSTEFPHWTSTW